MAEQTSTGYFQNVYKFNGKSQRSEDPDPSGELDAERRSPREHQKIKRREQTGLYYYGARYYDPRGSLWLSVDPMMEKYAGWSPYNYTVGNPVMFVDPDGKDILIWYKENNQNKKYRFNGTSTNLPNNGFVRKVVEGWTYNVANGGGDPSFEAATNPNVEINIVEYDQASISSEGVVYWNPELGTRTDNNTVLSPASVMDHEFDHQLDFAKDPVGHRKRAMTPDRSYETAKEKRVIEGSEQKTSRQNKEIIHPNKVTRKNHRGHSVVTKGIKSNVIDRKATYQYYKRIDRETPYNVKKYLEMYEK